MKYNIAPMLTHIKLTGEFEIKAGSAVLWSDLFAATSAPYVDY